MSGECCGLETLIGALDEKFQNRRDRYSHILLNHCALFLS